MMRSEAIDDSLWSGIVSHVISDSHIEKALTEHEADNQTDESTVSVSDLERRSGQLARAEQVLLDRLSRGLITTSALDRELVRLKAERSSVARAIVAARKATGSRNALPNAPEALRRAVAELRKRLRMATAADP
jgi:hypothetical protein